MRSGSTLSKLPSTTRPPLIVRPWPRAWLMPSRADPCAWFSAFSAGNAQYTGNFNWAYTVNSELSLSGTLGFNAFSAYASAGKPQSYFAFTPTLELSAALPGGPSQISAEYAYFSQAGPNLGSKSFVDFVYQRDFGPHVQFDVEYGFSPTLLNGQKQHYVGAGLSFMN